MKNHARVPVRNKAPRPPAQSRERRPAPAPKTEPLGFAPQFPNGSGVPHAASNRPVADGRNFPTASASSLPLVKRPRLDGRPGMEWELPLGMDLDPVLEAEGLSVLVFTTPEDERMGDLAARRNGSLVYLDDVQPGPVRFREVSPEEALYWYAVKFLPRPLASAFVDLKLELDALRRTATTREAA